MTKAATRRFFWWGTLLFSAVFIGLTLHTHTTIGARTNADRLSDDVVRGLEVWGKYNCENCHTLMGEGAYYAPDLTKIVSQRGRAYLEVFMVDPSRFYSEERDGRLMPTLGLGEQEIADVVSFLEWVGNVDLNGWPPRPILVAGVAIRGMPGVEGVQTSGEPVLRGKAVFHETAGCAGCHAIAGQTILVGTSLAGIAARAERRIASAEYTGEARSVEAYLREAITEPSAFVAQAPEGRSFTNPRGESLMPADYGTRLDEQQIDDLVAYLMTLKEEG
jgi:nitric oxide reductase subunit C